MLIHFSWLYWVILIRNYWEKTLWEIGLFKDVIASKAAFLELRRKKYIRYEALPLETKTGERVEVEFVSNLYKVNGKVSYSMQYP